MHELLTNFFVYCQAFLKILTKDGRMAPLVLKPYQIRIIEIIEEALRSGRPVRIIILKGRQMGISTAIAAYFYWMIATHFNQKLVLIADVSKRTDEVYSIYKMFLDQYPKEIRPMVDKDNERIISFQNPVKEERLENPGLQSRMIAETAQDKNAGRSGTAQLAHKTEAAYYPYAGEIDKGLGNSVPAAANTIIVEESTANGIAGDGAHFKSRWDQAVAGKNSYIPIFVGWYEADEYELAPEKDFKLTDDEIQLSKDMGKYSSYWQKLSQVQKNKKFAWRRFKLQEFAADTANTHDPDEVFDQEFPWCPSVAFLSSGNPVFDIKKLANQINEVENFKPINIAPIVKDTFVEDYLKGLKVFILPKKGMHYVVSGDVAEGVEGGDSSHLKVIDQNYRECACWHGQIDADLFGELMCGVGLLYNKALLAPEINSMGAATLSAIKRMKYWNIYNEEARKTTADLPTPKLGWRTTAANKKPMIGNVKALHRDNILKVYDVETLREMATIVRENNGDISINGKDRVAALAIACEAVKQLPLSTTGGFNPKEKKKSDTPEERRKQYQEASENYYA